MGCILSNLETKDTLRRCKERRRLMEEAMFGYNHLAYALVDYLRSLRRTGSSLSSFAEGEPHSSYYLRSRNSTCSFPQGDPSPSPSPEPLPTPTPPPPPQQQQPKMMAFKSPSLNPNPKPKPRGKAKAKVPHILSESSPSSSSLQSGLQAQSTHAGTSSQASSMGYWENIYPPPPPDSEFFNRRSTHSFAKSEDAGSSAASDKTGDILLDKAKMEVRPKDLKEIVDSLKDNFEEAAAAGNEVSDLLEIGRDQQHRSLRQLKKTVYHSRSLLSILISSWTSKPPLAVRYQLDAGSLDDPGGPKSLRSSLERLLAWEEKLYEDIKRREGMRIELKKKLSTLQNQECKGGDQAKLDKTEASIKRLQSLIFVTSQAVSTTSTAIIGLRDSDLVPQLIQLCHGFMHMWRSMNQYHEIQNNIVQQVRGLVNWATDVDSTSELHRQATLDLESDVTAWHSNFCRLIKLQRDFIRSLHGWFKLSLISVTTENINGNRETSDAYAFCEEWKLALERVPDTVASEAIKSFINVVHVISGKQTEELKMKKRTETASKELEKKASSLRNIEKKFYNSYSMVGIGLPDIGPDNGQVLDARDPLAEKKSELAACKRRVEDEFQRYSKAIEVTRAMTLNNLQTGLPGVFQALTSFSALFTESLQTVCTHSYAIK